jgi:copper transport protein
VALIPRVASAHAVLVGSDPAPDSVLASPPAAVTLLFSEPVTPAGAGIKVFAPSGKQVASAAVARGSVLVASVASSEVGTYVVSWQVFAGDTHPSRGTFAFAAGRASSNPYSALLNGPEVGTSTPAGLALQAMARWVHFAGFALVVGVVAYRLLVGQAEDFPPLVRVGVGLLIVAEPLALLGQLASLSFDGDTWLAVLGSGFGRLLGLRLGAALVIWTLLPTGRARPVLAAGGVMAVLDGFGTHAIPAVPLLGPLLVAVHVSAMGLWAGGLAAFVRAPDARFGRYALLMFGVAAATGLLLAFAHTHFGSMLLTTDYGRALLFKAVLVGGAGVAAALGRRRLELAVIFAVIAAAGVVASLPPPF